MATKAPTKTAKKTAAPAAKKAAVKKTPVKTAKLHAPDDKPVTPKPVKAIRKVIQKKPLKTEAIIRQAMRGRLTPKDGQLPHPGNTIPAWEDTPKAPIAAPVPIKPAEHTRPGTISAAEFLAQVRATQNPVLNLRFKTK